MSTPKRFSLPVVPISFILLLVVGAGIYWWFNQGDGDARLPKKPLNGDTLKVFRVPGGTLSTSGLTKTETLCRRLDHQETWLDQQGSPGGEGLF